MLRALIIVGITTLIWALVESADYTKIVQTTYGPVRGLNIEDDGFKYLSFTGIPYAAPPIEELRFKAPQPPEKWTTTKDATKFGRICHQPNQYDRLKLDVRSKLKLFMSNAPNVAKFAVRYLRQSEDCLFLNVYTKQLGDQGLKPVLVWIHGGGFFIGDGTDTIYGPEYLVDQDIVLVTFNYRLGPLGFLSTNSTDSPGNWGMKDQVAAMKWVQDNIANFGGDPKQVTIYGESAGGASVHYHLLSPLSRGLYQRAIVSSGSALNSWASTDQQERFSKNLARVLEASESEIEDPGRRVQFLRKVPPKTLTNRMLYALEDEDFQNGIMTKIPFPPVVEPAGTEGAFLLGSPSQLVAEGNFAKVPTIMGFNDLEGGLMNMGFSKYTTPESLQKLEAEPCSVLPGELRSSVEAKNDCAKVLQQIKDVYFGGKGLNSSQIDFAYLFGDIAVANGMHLSQKWHARLAKKDNPVYYYYFSYDGEWNMVKKLYDSKLPGAVHGDDLTYVFKPRIMKLPFKEPTVTGVKTKERMVYFITNFVKRGNPTPTTNDLAPIKWETAKENELNTLHIDGDIKMEKEILKTRMDLWDSLYKKYIGTPIYN